MPKYQPWDLDISAVADNGHYGKRAGQKGCVSHRPGRLHSPWPQRATFYSEAR
jgi:hypothetical protein